MALGDGIGRNKGINHWTQSRQDTYYRGVKDFIEWLLSNDKYAACTIDTDDNCIVCDVGLIEDMYTVSTDELYKEFKRIKDTRECSNCGSFQDRKHGCGEEHEQLAEWLEELKQYKQLEEQGLLLRLPCKIGTEVWYICLRDTISLVKDAVYKGIITRVYVMEKEVCVTIKIHNEYGCTEVPLLTEFGKTVFLTKEEAEQALEKMKKEV